MERSKLIFCLVVIFSFDLTSVKSYPVKNPADILAYLERFGYLAQNNNIQLRIGNEKIQEAMKKFQYFAGIPKTGVLDQATMRAMNMPRCGNSEIISSARKKRYVLDSKWEKTFLTYRILNYPKSGISKAVVDKQVEQAFQYWANATNIHVKRSIGPVETDLELSFVTGAHNDGIEFDNIEGVGRVIAHAWKPFNNAPLRGDLHFNDEVTWTSGPGQESEGFDFLRTAVHEVGHSLGLEHSPHRDAIMYFAVSGHSPDLRLSLDDLAGIKELYGEKVNTDKISHTRSGPIQLKPGPVTKPPVVPSGTPDDPTPWECYRLQEENPKNLKGIRTCYQQFYRDFYLRNSQG